jgi:FKBP-type peptidyl-prolyl cis-trans isomerase
MYILKTETTENEMPTSGNTVKVNYKGMLTNGKVFDQSTDGRPLEFQIGRQMVIPGWDEGIAMLRRGEKAVLLIPSYLAYGDEGVQGVIAPGDALIFEVELIDIK